MSWKFSPAAIATISNVEICSGQLIFHVLGNGWCSVKQISSFKQLAIFAAVFLQTDSVLLKPESLGIKQAARLVCSK